MNIGLEPWEATEMELEVETVPQGDKRKAVADYVLDREEDGAHWEEWLQTHRVELNAMTTPQSIQCLDDKMEAHGVGKLVPPGDEPEAEWRAFVETAVAKICRKVKGRAITRGQRGS